MVQINLPIHCFPLQFPHKGRQICCKMKENYQEHLCGNQSTHLNLFNSIFRDPCHVSAKRTTSVSLKMQLYHVKHYLKSINNYIFPNFHLCIQNLSVKVKVEGKKYNLGSYKMGHDSKLKCYNHSRARSSC